MASRKSSGPSKGLLSRLRAFVDALGDRYQRALQVVDEALASENLKEKMWAVNLILKQAPPPERETSSPEKRRPEKRRPGKGAPDQDNPDSSEEDDDDDTDPEKLEEGELIRRIRRYLREPEP